jgi:hypothetical protein
VLSVGGSIDAAGFDKDGLSLVDCERGASGLVD